MELFEAIRKRHSYRGEFDRDHKISRDELEKIVTAGVQAPSGCNKQTTEFVIIDDPQKLAELSMIHTNTAPAMIVCVVNREPIPVYQELSFEIEDCSAAVENMLLAITAMGYATVWLDGVLRGDGIADKIAKTINLPENKVVRILLPVGKPVKAGPTPEKIPFKHRASFNTYSL